MATYVVDSRRSSIEFKVKHLMIATVSGCFKKFHATMKTSTEDFVGASLVFSADVESLSTGVADRDSHLRSSEVFDCQKWPKIFFESTEVKKTSSWSYEIIGNLTIKNISLPVTLLGTHNGVVTDCNGKIAHTFEMHGILSRKEFGLNFNVAGLGNSVLVDDAIRLFVKVVAAEAIDEQ